MKEQEKKLKKAQIEETIFDFGSDFGSLIKIEFQVSFENEVVRESVTVLDDLIPIALPEKA